MTKNAALENFMTRRSIRAFKSDPVDRETLQEIIEAGRSEEHTSELQSRI